MNERYTARKKSSMLYKYLIVIPTILIIGCGNGDDGSSSQSSSSTFFSSSSSKQSSSSISSSSVSSSEYSSLSSQSSSQSSEPIVPISRTLLIFNVNYNNEQFSSDATTWSSQIFGNNIHELNHYMREVSNGNFIYNKANESQGIINDGVITITLNKEHPDSGSSPTIQGDLANIVKKADDYIDYASFDSNDDGIISYEELVPVFIIAGNEDAYSGATSANGVYAHQGCTNGVNAPIVDNVRLMLCSKGTYAIFGERHNDPVIPAHDATIGIIAHELGHAALNLPDLYDTSNQHAGIGFFGLMGAGMWGQSDYDDYPGNTPTHMCAWSKIDAKFIAPKSLSKVDNYDISLKQSSENNYTIIKVPINEKEYFLLENRNNNGYDRGLFSLNEPNTFNGGLAIWHIDTQVITQRRDNNNINNNKDHKGVDLEEANNAELDDGGNNPGHTNNLYFESNKASFTPFTSPNSSDYNKQESGVSITNISEQSASMQATITNPN